MEGKHDFSTFRASSCTSNSPLKKLIHVKVKKKGDKISIEFKSKSFLQNQVRSMVGCLNIYQAKVEFKSIQKVFKSKRARLCTSSTCMGLYLTKINLLIIT